MHNTPSHLYEISTAWSMEKSLQDILTCAYVIWWEIECQKIIVEILLPWIKWLGMYINIFDLILTSFDMPWYISKFISIEFFDNHIVHAHFK